MAEYAKTYLTDIVSVRTIRTIFHTDLSKRLLIPEAHNFWEFIYLEKGYIRVMINDNEYPLEGGQLILYPPLAVHGEAFVDGDAPVSVVSFDSESEVLLPMSKKVITLSSKQCRTLSQVMDLGEKCFKFARYSDTNIRGMVPREGTDPIEMQNIKNLLELLLLDIYVNSDNSAARLRGSNNENQDSDIFIFVTKYLKNNLNKSLVIDDICRDCGLSPSKLKRICSRECGMSPMAYFTFLKINAAKQMIRDTSLNFTQISQALGFSTVHYFSKLFKEKVGMSPSEYAKSI